MNRQKENICSLLGRITMIGLLLFIVILFKGTDCNQKYFFCQSAPIPIAQVFDIDHSVILASPVSLPNLNSSFVAAEIFTLIVCNPINNAIICSNQKVNQLLKNCREQFIVFKPSLIDFDLYHNRTSLSTAEIPPIS